MRGNAEAPADFADGHLEKVLVGERVEVKSVLVFSGAKGAPDPQERKEEADDDSPSIQKIGNERIAAGAKLPGADLCFSHLSRFIAGENMMQVVGRYGKLA